MPAITRPVSAAALLALTTLVPVSAQAQTPSPAAVPPATTESAASMATEDARALSERLDTLLGRPAGLTSDAVATAASRTSFDLRARQADVTAAAAGVDQAYAAYFPRLGVLGRYSRLSPLDPPNLGNLVTPANPAIVGPVPSGTQLISFPFTFPIFLNSYIVEATLNIPLSDYLFRLPQAYRSAQGGVRAAELTAQSTRLRVETDARLAYYTWVRARLQVAVAEQALAQARGHLTDVGHSFDVGAVSRADVLRVESQVANAELLVARAQSLEAVTANSVRTAMHTAAPRTLEIGEDVRSNTVDLPGGGAMEPLLEEAWRARPELQALDAQTQSLREQSTVARATIYPRLDAVGEVQYSNPNQRVFPPQDTFTATWALTAQVTWSPNDVALGTAAARTVDARVAALEAQRESIRDGIRAEVVAAWQAAREAEIAVASTGRGLTSAEEGYRVRRELFRNGRATSVELTDAETDLTRARLEALNARVDQRVARVRLLHAVGRDGQ